MRNEQITGEKHTEFWCRDLKERDNMEDKRIILKWIFKKWDGNMDCTDLAQDRDRWPAVVNK